jgi:hypothetical protein
MLRFELTLEMAAEELGLRGSQSGSTAPEAGQERDRMRPTGLGALTCALVAVAGLVSKLATALKLG